MALAPFYTGDAQFERTTDGLLASFDLVQ